MAQTFKLSVVSPDRTVVEEQVQALIAPGAEGYMGVLAGHEPVIVALKTGVMEYTDAAGQRHYASISGGFMELDGRSAIVLADTAERSTEIDVERAQRALDRARAALRGEETETTSQEAAAELARAVNRIKAARKP